MKEKDAQNGPEKPTFKIRVKERKLGRHKAMGLAHPDGLIEIDPRTPPKEYLDTLIHELLHQARPSSYWDCLLYTSPSPRDAHESRMPSSA